MFKQGKEVRSRCRYGTKRDKNEARTSKKTQEAKRRPNQKKAKEEAKKK